jgi:flagellar hook-length control protein FliK
MIQLPSTLLEPPAPPPASHGDPPGDPGTPFATVLDDHQARTAVAEGQQREDTAPAVPEASRERDDRDEDDGAPRKPAAGHSAADAAPVAALLGAPVPLPVVAAAGQAEPEPVGGRVLTLPRATRPIGVPGPGAGVAGSPAGAPATAAGTAAAAATARLAAAGTAATALSPSMTLGQGAAAAEGDLDGADAKATASGQARAAPPAAGSRLASALQAASAAAHAGPAAGSVPPPASAAAIAAHGARSGATGAATQPHQATPAATPAVAPSDGPASVAAADATAAATSADAARGVGLEHAVETVRLALRAAAERGVTHARISLNPRELGAIEIHLRQTADGLVARVVAQHAAAAQLLQHAGAELRRALESQGLDLLRLDVGASGEEGRRGRGDALANGATCGRERRSGRGAGADAEDPLAPLDGAAGAGETTAILALPNGALIDVLA